LQIQIKFQLLALTVYGIGYLLRNVDRVIDHLSGRGLCCIVEGIELKIVNGEGESQEAG
jgi:hypothetical protein